MVSDMPVCFFLGKVYVNLLCGRCRSTPEACPPDRQLRLAAVEERLDMSTPPASNNYRLHEGNAQGNSVRFSEDSETGMKPCWEEPVAVWEREPSGKAHNLTPYQRNANDALLECSGIPTLQETDL